MSKEQKLKQERGEEGLTDLEKLLKAEAETRKKYLEGSSIVLPELDEGTRQKILDLFGSMDPEPPTAEERMNEYFNRPRTEESLTDEELDKDLAGGRYKIPITLRANPALKTLMGKRRT